MAIGYADRVAGSEELAKPGGSNENDMLFRTPLRPVQTNVPVTEGSLFSLCDANVNFGFSWGISRLVYCAESAGIYGRHLPVALHKGCYAM